MPDTMRPDVAEYLRDAIDEVDDLTGDAHEEMVDSIESAVLEVAAEFPDDLETLLGTPADFVAEMRTAAGFGAASNRQRRSHRAWVSVRESVHRRASTVTSHRWTQWMLQLLRELRPASWVVRGYGFAMLLGVITSGVLRFDWFLFLPAPNVFGSPALSHLVLVALVVASVELGRRELGGWRRRIVSIASVAAAVMLIGGINELHETGVHAAQLEAEIANVHEVTAGPVDDLFGIPLAGIILDSDSTDGGTFIPIEILNRDEIRSVGTLIESGATVSVVLEDGQTIGFDSAVSYYEALGF